MRICEPWLLTKSRLEDQITLLNLVYPGRTLFVGKRWFSKVVEHGFEDDLCFNLVIVNNYVSPYYPVENYEKT